MTLPRGWANAKISDLVEPIKQRIPKADEIIDYLDIGSIDREAKKIVGSQQIIGTKAPSRARKVVRAGDVLVSMTRPNLNAVALVPDNFKNPVASTGFEVLRSVMVDPRWLFNQVRGQRFIDEMSDLVQGALYPAIRSSDVQAFELALPPLDEQKRIADKLDQTLAIVERAKARLARVPEILKQFRQSVLAAATSGKLTEDWRPDSHESQDNGFPKEWSLCQIKDAGRIQLGRQRAPKFHSGDNMRPYLRVQNVFEERIDLSDVMEMDFPGDDFVRYQLHPGDILLNEGQSPEYLGRPAMYRGELPGACFTNTLIRFQAYDHVVPDFALLVFRNHMHSGRYSSEGTITTNIAHLGAGRFGTVEFPVPPMGEQREIIRRVETLFALADRIDARYKAISERVDKLTQSLLAKAFRGELVPQDQNDEPASVLLNSIRAQRAAGPVSKQSRRKRAQEPA